MTEKKTYLIKTPIGDPSHDGHGKTKEYTYFSNKSPKELEAIHGQCQALYGFHIGEIACAYEAPYIPARIETILTEVMNLPIHEVLCMERDYDLIRIEPYECFKLWMMILQKIEPSLHYEMLTTERWRVGGDSPGYGCFY